MTAKEAKRLRKRLERIHIDGTVLPWGTLVINDTDIIYAVIAWLEEY